RYFSPSRDAERDASTHLPTVSSAGGAGGGAFLRRFALMLYVTETNPAPTSWCVSPTSAITAGFGPAGTSGMSARTETAPLASRVSLTRNSVAGGGGVYGRSGAGFDRGVRQPATARIAAGNVRE